MTLYFLAAEQACSHLHSHKPLAPTTTCLPLLLFDALPSIHLAVLHESWVCAAHACGVCEHECVCVRVLVSVLQRALDLNPVDIFYTAAMQMATPMTLYDTPSGALWHSLIIPYSCHHPL